MAEARKRRILEQETRAGGTRDIAARRRWNRESMLRHRVLRSLGDTRVRLAPTSHGVGVVAIRDIPEGTDPFPRAPNVPTVRVGEEDLARLDPAVQNLVRDFFLSGNRVYDFTSDEASALEDTEYAIPVTGLAGIDASFYVNHSAEHPNLVAVHDGNTFLNTFRTTRAVRAGEELLFDYNRH